MFKKIFLFLMFFLLTFGVSAQLKPVEKQYIKDAPWNKNPGFEQGKSNYSLYKDADQAIPENMTGGTSDLKIALNSTNPIDGNRDLIITKDGSASRRGNGLSFPVTIPAGMQGQMLEMCVQYRTSAGYVDNDAIVYAYDVTNSSLASTEPAPRDLKAYAASTGSATHCSYVQALSNSTQYRFGIHISSTSAVDYTITIDNFWISKVNQVNGAVVTAWESETGLTWTSANWTGAGNFAAKKRRVGDTLEIEGTFSLTGTPTGGGDLYLYLPSYYVIDTGKISNTTTSTSHLGVAKYIDTGTGTYEGTIAYGGTNRSLVFSYNGTTNIGITNITSPFTFGNTDIITFKIKIPITGWGATGILGQDATTQVVASKAYLSANQTIAPNNSSIKINFNSTSPNKGGGWSTSGYRYDCFVSGTYKITPKLNINGTNVLDGNYYSLRIFKNGLYLTNIDGIIATASTPFTAKGSDLIDLNAGDYIEVYLYGGGDNSTNQLTVASGASESYVLVERLSGPANVAVSESVEVVAVNGASTAFGATGATVALPFATEEKDTHGAFSGNVFTAPISGAYLVNLQITVVSNSSVDGQLFDMFADPSNSQEILWFRSAPLAHDNLISLSGSKVFNLIQGQTITFNMRSYYASGSAPTLYSGASTNMVSITRIGN